MYNLWNDLLSVLPGLAALLWLLAGYRAARLTYRPTVGKLCRSARYVLVLVFVATIPAVALLLIVEQLWSMSWQLADSRVTVMAPLLLFPLLSVVSLAVPRLVRVARLGTSDRAAPTEAWRRGQTAAPELVVPIQVTAAGALLTMYFDLFRRPVSLTPAVGAEFWLPLVVVAVLLWLRQSRRQRSTAPTPTVGRRVLRTAVILAVLTAVVLGGGAYLRAASRLPAEFSMADTGYADFGGGPAGMAGMAGMPGMPGMVSVNSLTGATSGIPDDVFTLTAAPKKITLSSGRTLAGDAFNNQVPGPELVVHQGDLVQVTLVNRLPHGGVTLHWHGLDVPNAEDGVPGVTQNAVQPGQTFVYRFRPEQVGTFWYHTHDDPAELVRLGLFGAIVVLPHVVPLAKDITVLAHTWEPGNVPSFGTTDTLLRTTIAPGTQVRLRLINTDNNPVAGQREEAANFALAGTAFRVASIDGTELNKPTDLHGVRLLLASGGRYDLTFTMPDHPVRLMGLGNPNGGELFSPDGRGTVAAVAANAPVFDPAHYGSRTATPFGPSSRFNRQFTMVLDDRLGFYDGIWHQTPTINGDSFPNTPMFVVHQGDLVKVTIVNRSHNNHPMHLHGHHVLVLSRDGQQTTGSPWWTDTLDVQPGQVMVYGFLADNPGIWMDHCHNLDHAAAGMMMHLVYDNVTSPYQVGRDSGNLPE